MKKIVIFGGGSGLSQLLKGLKLFPLDITAVVSVSDNGKSTGRLRKEMNIPAVGDITKVMNPTPIDDKFEAFGWNVLHIDGHNFAEIEAAYKKAETLKGKPTMILAKTIKGKGVSFMENQAGWHGKAPNSEELALALKELEAQ